jgi:hypothetical protein
MSPLGTFETCRRTLNMSACRPISGQFPSRLANLKSAITPKSSRLSSNAGNRTIAVIVYTTRVHAFKHRKTEIRRKR